MKYPLLILTIFLFSACGSSENLQGQLKLQNSTDKLTTENGDLETAQAQLDQDFIYMAVKEQNVDLCDTIAASEQKNECITRVNDENLTKEAVATASQKSCSKISASNLQKRCEELVQIALDRQNESATLQSQSDQLSQVIAKGDAKACSSLQDKNFQEACRSDIAINQAIAKKDPSLCQGLQSEVKEICELQAR